MLEKLVIKYKNTFKIIKKISDSQLNIEHTKIRVACTKSHSQLNLKTMYSYNLLINSIN